MTASQELVARENQVFFAIEKAIAFPQASLSLVGLKLTDPEMSFGEWENIGRSLGHAHRWSAWALGDWINFGEAIYGQEAFNATEGIAADRYDVAGRVTGLAHGTLLNYASQCGRIAMSIRRVELPFGTHGPVAALEAADQVKWLQLAVDNAWTREELRDAIAGRTPEDDGGDGDGDGDGGSGGLTVSERIEEAARLVWRQASSNSDGDWVVPSAPMSQLAAALGED